MPSKVGRLVSLDMARAVAIALALFAHGLATFGVAPERRVGVNLVTHSATPLLMVLFGMMLELVYLRYLETRGAKMVARRLGQRSLTIYSYWMGLAMVAFVVGLTPFRGVLRAALLAGPVRLSNILVLFVIACLFAFPLLLIRQRWGLGPVYLTLVAVWLTAPLIDRIHPSSLGLMRLPLAGLIGVGDRIGPSLWHGLTLILVGVLLAERLARQGRRGFYRLALATGVISLAVLIGCAWRVPGPELLHHYLTGVYRCANHPIFYATGLVCAMVVLVGVMGLVPEGCQLNRFWAFWRPLGTSSLKAFSLGNALFMVAQAGHFETFCPPYASALAVLAMVAWLTPRLTLRVEPAVNHQRLSLNQVAQRAGQEQDRVGHVPGREAAPV